MNKKLLRRLIFPPFFAIFLLTVASTSLLVYVFVADKDDSVLAYAVYVLSFYTLSVLCVFCVKTLPPLIKRVKEALHRNRFADKYLTNVAFRTHVSLYRSLAVNMLYAAANAFLSVIYSTAWFALFASYYAIFAIMRFLLVRYVSKNGIGKNRMGELKRSRICAFVLLAVTPPLSGAVMMSVYFNRGKEYKGVLIYVMAMYTFYVTGSAIKDIVKYRKYKSPIMSASKTVKLASAMISVYSLETAMLAQFGTDMSDYDRRLMLILTGAGISAVIVTLAVGTAVYCTRELKKIGGEKNERKR